MEVKKEKTLHRDFGADGVEKRSRGPGEVGGGMIAFGEDSEALCAA